MVLIHTAKTERQKDMTTDVNALIDGIIAESKNYEERVKEEAKKIFAAVTEAMKEHPNVGLRWRQYTPYFNDGEECTFSVHDIEVFGIREGEDEDDDEYEYGDGGLTAKTLAGALHHRNTGEVLIDPSDWYVKHYGEEKYKKIRAAEYQAFNDLSVEQLSALATSVVWAADLADKLSSLPDDVFRNAFGDHVKISLSHKGAAVEEYSHD